MRRLPTPISLIGAMLRKDLRLYSRDRVYVFLTILGLVFFVAIFWLTPNTVDETITLAISPSIQELVADARETLIGLGVPEEHLSLLDEMDVAEQEGLVLVDLDDEQQIRGVIEGSVHVYRTREDGKLIVYDPESGSDRPRNARKINVNIGIAFPRTFITDVAVGNRPTVTLYSDASVPRELTGAMQSFVRELAFAIAGQELPVTLPDEQTIILGQDRMGEQPSLRDKLKPMLVFFVFLIETFSMAALISTEVARRTVTALMVTPLSITQFLAAKSIFGVGLALSQGLIIILLLGAFTAQNFLLLMTVAVAGAIMFTGIAMIVGAAGKDFMGQLMYSTLFTIPLMIPTFSVLFPGSVAAWVQVIPSYPIIDMLVGVTVYGAGWAESLGSLVYTLVWVVIIYGAGLVVLKRKVASL